MKQFFLSFAAMLLFTAGANAQQVEVFNNLAACDVDVTVTSYDALCNVLTVFPTQTINPLPSPNSYTFVETSGTAVDFRINVVGSSTNPPPALSFMSDTKVLPSSCVMLPVTVGSNGSGCGGRNGNVVVLPNTGTALPNLEVLIDPN